MRLTQKLLNYLNRVFDKDPVQFLALRLSYDGVMTWGVSDAVLTTAVTGGTGQALQVDLADHTISSLATFLAAQPGYTVLYVDSSELAQLSARVLLDGGADIATSNGDHLYGYTSVLWAYLEAVANELTIARQQIAQALRQMNTRTAEGIWLDELGGYYGVPRLAGELDGSYGPRIIAEVLRPRQNNVAIEEAIRVFTGQDTTVTDVTAFAGSFPAHNGQITHNGAYNYSSVDLPAYGLFDVAYGYDLINGGSFEDFQQVITDLINRLRSAGTHLRALSLVGSKITDDFQHAPVDAATIEVSADLADAADAPTESTVIKVTAVALEDLGVQSWDDAGMAVAYGTTYNGLRRHDAVARYNSGQVEVEAL
jgi:hypothetical protein